MVTSNNNSYGSGVNTLLLNDIDLTVPTPIYQLEITRIDFITLSIVFFPPSLHDSSFFYRYRKERKCQTKIRN